MANPLNDGDINNYAVAPWDLNPKKHGWEEKPKDDEYTKFIKSLNADDVDHIDFGPLHVLKFDHF